MHHSLYNSRGYASWHHAAWSTASEGKHGRSLAVMTLTTTGEFPNTKDTAVSSLPRQNGCILNPGYSISNPPHNTLYSSYSKFRSSLTMGELRNHQRPTQIASTQSRFQRSNIVCDFVQIRLRNILNHDDRDFISLFALKRVGYALHIIL